MTAPQPSRPVATPAAVGDPLFIRVVQINGDARQGRYLGRDDTHLYLWDGRRREIGLVMIDTIDPVAPPNPAEQPPAGQPPAGRR
jgi:hypothetical protein